MSFCIFLEHLFPSSRGAGLNKFGRKTLHLRTHGIVCRTANHASSKLALLERSNLKGTASAALSGHRWQPLTAVYSAGAAIQTYSRSRHQVKSLELDELRCIRRGAQQHGRWPAAEQHLPDHQPRVRDARPVHQVALTVAVGHHIVLLLVDGLRMAVEDNEARPPQLDSLLLRLRAVPGLNNLYLTK